MTEFARPRLLALRTWRPRGDHSYLLALVVLLGLLLLTALGPLQSLVAATSRVEALESTRERLRSDVAALDLRRDRLSDPEELELIARDEFNLVKPGEVPFIVVAPEPELALDRLASPGEVDRPWYQRMSDAVRRWLP